MTGYVLQRIDQGGGYVTPAGSLRSYTKALQHARIFPTREAAERERCGNERILTLEQAVTT